MASKDQVESLTGQATCSICLDFFTDPVSLECGHNFCRSCITQSWDKEGRNSCPGCKEEFADRTLRVNRALVRLSEKFRALSLNRTEKESKLQSGREHKSHSFTSVKEAVDTYKDQVKDSIEFLTKNKSEIQRMEQQQEQKISEVLEQSLNLQSKITSQFAEQHKILTEKEQRALADIGEEEKKILNTMETNLGGIQDNLKSIQEELLKLQQQMDEKDSVVFLKEEAGRKQRGPYEAKLLSVVDDNLLIEKFENPFLYNTVLAETPDAIKPGTTVDSVSSLENDPLPTSPVYDIQGLYRYRGTSAVSTMSVPAARTSSWERPVLGALVLVFNGCRRPRGTSASVTLDVETAHLLLEVSEDRKRVRLRGTRRSLPDTGKRFTGWRCALGSEGFTSGRHYWEVEVAGSRRWSLGVAAESVERKKRATLIPETGVWSIGRWGDGFVAFASLPSPLPARSIPGRMGIYLSYESGTVSFYDADTKSHLHTFTRNKFTDKLYPFFEPWHEDQWLRICSVSAPGV
ncbi:RING finger protein 39-like [Leucoraja erinacea]|uniref:RING finger protein 39-like n=1 Tax=Leucoraja erinaceus TaxID=7782 RepID=UPI0024567A1C|nr:RING finger protein 39-like [Leucoraja erinacea]